MPVQMPSCEDGAGSINTENASADQSGIASNVNLKPYVPPNTCVGEWDISTATDDCATNEKIIQHSRAEEVLSIAGAPINIYKLLGIHEQGIGSVISEGTVAASLANPGYPVSNINSGTGSWQSAQAGAAVVTAGAYVAVDFGFKMLSGGTPENQSPRPNWQTVAAVILTQANTAFNYARQVRVDVTDGTVSNVGQPIQTGVGNGTIVVNSIGPSAAKAAISVIANNALEFTVMATPVVGSPIVLGVAAVGQLFQSTYVNLTISTGTIPFASGDLFTFTLDYNWTRAGVFNLVQSAAPAVLNLQMPLLVKAVRVTPTLYTATSNWEVLALDVVDSAPTDINNIQDLFFNENRDRDYNKTPLTLKCQYAPNDSISDLSKFGLNIMDQYSFTTSFSAMVKLLGRPLVTGDILELPMETMYDQNLKPIRKFLEVTDTGWAADGFSPSWTPMIFRFAAQQALPSQETRDIFGTLDTQKYLVADSVLTNGIGSQIDITPLTQTEEIIKEANKAVPEVGDDAQLSTDGVKVITPAPLQNAKPTEPQPMTPAFKANVYVEDGLPKNGEAYGEGYELPDATGATDGEYFRLNYPESTNIPPRLYRFSLAKNRWIFMETDRRGTYSSHKPSVRNILQSNTKQGLKKKLT